MVHEGFGPVGGAGRELQGRRYTGEDLFESGTAATVGLLAQIEVADGEQVEDGSVRVHDFLDALGWEPEAD